MSTVIAQQPEPAGESRRGLVSELLLERFGALRWLVAERYRHRPGGDGRR